MSPTEQGTPAVSNVSFYEIPEGQKPMDADLENKLKESLHRAINSTNLIVLLGSGASKAAIQPNRKHKGAPTMDDLWDEVKNCVSGNQFKCIVSTILKESQKKDVERLLSLCKMKIELNGELKFTPDGEGESEETIDLNSFVKSAEQKILERVDFLSSETDLSAHKEFFRRLTSRSVEKPRLKIFTTNYDRCIEEATEGIVLIDGFSHSSIQKFNQDNFHHDIVRRSPDGTSVNYIENVAYFYKMHGSLDWRRRKSDAQVIKSVENSDGYEPVLIFPRSSKYQESFRQPYLDMFTAWQTALRQPDTTLVISGFGFSDDHISAPIWSALESNLTFRLLICDPSVDAIMPTASASSSTVVNEDKFHESPNYRNLIIRLAYQGDTRITLIKGTFRDLAMKIPEATGETERRQVRDLIAQAIGAKNVT